jgi:anaerobic magnesium-protoporphyrin IX monomethyl ester cyclase
MRVACVNYPWTVGERRGVRAGSRWPFTSVPEKDGRLLYVPFPFFLATAVSLLNREGFDARCFDAIADQTGADEVISQIASFGPRLLVAETSTPSFSSDIGVLNKFKSHCPQTAVVLAGPHASVFAKEILDEYPFVDYVAVGEYEWTVLDLARSLEKNTNGDAVLGLAARKKNDIGYAPRPLLEDLDMLPWPERASLPMARYNDGFCGLPQPNVQMMTSRGCPFECIFCVWPQVMYPGRRTRTRSARDVVDEMEALVKQYAFRAVYFDDDIFNAARSHVLAICAEIKKRGLRILWAAMARPDLMDKELLEAMAGSGLYAVKYGVESADPEVLKNSRKNMDLAKTRSVIAMTRGLGIKVHLTFCLGLPGETRQTVQKTRDFIKDAEPDSAQFAFATPFPGTEYFRIAREKGFLLPGSWDDFDGDRKCVVRTEALSGQEIEELYGDIRRHTCF